MIKTAAELKTCHSFILFPRRQLMATNVHEIGHNLGATHDCCTKYSCEVSQLADGTDQVCPGETVTSGGKTYKFNPSHPLAKCVPNGVSTDTATGKGGFIMYVLPCPVPVPGPVPVRGESDIKRPPFPETGGLSWFRHHAYVHAARRTPHCGS